jgi:hypothetical protein
VTPVRVVRARAIYAKWAPARRVINVVEKLLTFENPESEAVFSAHVRVIMVELSEANWIKGPRVQQEKNHHHPRPIQENCRRETLRGI